MPDSALVVHDVPGRLRIRLSAGARIDGLVEAVSKQAGVMSATWSEHTRGLLVLYRPEVTSNRTLIDAVTAHAGVGLLPAKSAWRPSNGRPTLVGAVTDTVAEVNAAVGRLTGGIADLRTLVPLGLVVWAARQILRGQAGPLAWSAALWYAHGLFRDYGLGESNGGDGGDNGE
jgi:hypothetical protein